MADTLELIESSTAKLIDRRQLRNSLRLWLLRQKFDRLFDSFAAEFGQFFDQLVDLFDVVSVELFFDVSVELFFDVSVDVFVGQQRRRRNDVTHFDLLFYAGRRIADDNLVDQFDRQKFEQCDQVPTK